MLRTFDNFKTHVQDNSIKLMSESTSIILRNLNGIFFRIQNKHNTYIYNNGHNGG